MCLMLGTPKKTQTVSLAVYEGYNRIDRKHHPEVSHALQSRLLFAERPEVEKRQARLRHARK